jgi:hypothetical protein
MTVDKKVATRVDETAEKTGDYKVVVMVEM